MKKIRYPTCAMLMLAALLLAACGGGGGSDPVASPPTTAAPPTTAPPVIQETTRNSSYDDLSYIEGEFAQGKTLYEAGEYSLEKMYNHTFNEASVFKGSEALQAEIMEAGKNPGLGARSLHAQGITGAGVNVAIIDVNLLLSHPEFAGKIAAYYDSGCEKPSDEGSMHAPAVTGILVGETVGVAPGAAVYFAAAPVWRRDAAYAADCLNWIIAENEKLPDGEKIRVVSLSAAPSGPNSEYINQHLWDEAVEAARRAGIVVLDCRENTETGFVMPAYYNRTDPEAPAKCYGGFPDGAFAFDADYIGAPASYRTVAEEYTESTPAYRYFGIGGLNWAVPYAAGVLALGWQVNPDLDGDQMVALLFQTAARGKNGCQIVDPIAFIDAVEETVKYDD